jgi:hypothetical protein
MDKKFLRIDIRKWIFGTIERIPSVVIQSKSLWNNAWLDAYLALEGTSMHSGKKSCPKNGARVLYESGRLEGTSISYQELSLQDIWDLDSKSGVYSLTATMELKKNPSVNLVELREAVFATTLRKFGSAPKSDQGAIKLAYILCRLQLIRKVNVKGEHS